MFGLEDEDDRTRAFSYRAPRAMSGADPQPFYEFSNKQAGWYIGVLNTPMTGVSLLDGSSPVTLPGGTLVRVYKGTLPAQSGQNLTTPNSAGQYIVEPAPDNKSHYWSFYVETPDSLALLQSPAWLAESQARTARLVALKIDPTDDSQLAPLSDSGVDPDAFNAIGLPPASGGGGGSKPPAPATTKPPATAAVGGAVLALGALALLAMMGGKK